VHETETGPFKIEKGGREVEFAMGWGCLIGKGMGKVDTRGMRTVSQALKVGKNWPWGGGLGRMRTLEGGGGA